MRVLIVTSWATDVIGGSGTAVFYNSFVAGLRGRGLDVTVIAPNFDTSNYVDVTLQRFLFNTQLRTDPRVQQADVIIGFDFDGYGLDPATRPPMISSAHAIYGDLVKWETDPVRTMVYAQAYFDRVAMQQANLITTGSQYAADRLVALYGLPAEKVRVIPHGMLEPAWMRLVSTEPRRENDHPVLLSVGKMYPRKRLEILLRAIPLLAEKYPSLEARIVGDGLDWDKLHGIAAELGIEQHVTWLGHISDDAQFAREWRQADVFVHPSAQESFGYVYLEAMMLGKPIVATRAGAAPEVVGDGGLLAEPENPAALAAAIDTFLADAAMREEYGRRAQERAPRFSQANMLDGYMRAIETVAAMRQPSL